MGKGVQLIKIKGWKWAKLLFCFIFFGLSACQKGANSDEITFAVTSDYPPFEYKVRGELQGFDIDLARLVAKEMGKTAVFQDMQFSSVLPALQSGHVDAAISTITVTEDRKQHFDFSNIYYNDSIAVVYKDAQPINSKADLVGKKISCLLGSSVEIWLKKNGFTAQTITMDTNNQAVEALKANHVDVAIMDKAQAQLFSKKNPHLAYHVIDQSEEGYAIVLRKGSPLLAAMNQAIEKLKQQGDIKQLEEKWLSDGELP